MTSEQLLGEIAQAMSLGAGLTITGEELMAKATRFQAKGLDVIDPGK